MQKANLAFEGPIADDVIIQAAREATKSGLWHYRWMDNTSKDWSTWIRQPEYLDGMIMEDGRLMWGRSVLDPISADKIRLPE